MPQLTPLISVIIPVYNAARYIGVALGSVLSQNVVDYEIIVVDDGSTDDLTAVLEQYQEHIQFIQQENSGSAAARNTGLDQACGEFVVFLDADDLMLPGKLRQQAAYLQLHVDLGYVHSGWNLIDENGRHLQTVQPWRDAPELNLESWLQYKSVQLGAVMFRRIWLDRVGGLDPTLRQAHDVDLMLRLSLAGCVGVWLYEATICYRYHRTSTIHYNVTTQVESVLALLDKFFARPDLPSEIKVQKSKTYYYTTLWLAWYATSNDDCQIAMPLLQRTLALAPQVNGLLPVNTIVEWMVHFAAWDRENGFQPAAFQSIQPIFQEAAPSGIAWAELERLAAWWQADQPALVRQTYAPHDLWRIFQSGLDWERGRVGLSAEMALSWLALVWKPYLNEAYDTAVSGWASFPELDKTQLVHLICFGLAADSEDVTTALLSLLWSDVQHNHLPAAAELDEAAFFAGLTNLRRPKVSVIVPVFNGAAYIEATIESVLRQTYRDFELIVVNDGSTDGTADLLRPYRGQIRLVRQQNQGVSAARNHGLKLALGEFILFLDGDDLLLPDKLAKQVACLEENHLLGAVHSGWQLVDEYGRSIRNITPWNHVPGLTLLDWLRWKPVFLGAMLFRRNWLIRIDNFNTNLRQAEDTDFLLRLSLAGCPMIWLKETTVYYRQHGAGVTQNGRRQAIDLMRTLNAFFENKKLPAHIQQIEPTVRQHTLVWLVWQLYRTGYLQEMVLYLQEAAQVANQPPIVIAQSWLVQFASYAWEEGEDLTRLTAMFPYFKKALLVEGAAWRQLERSLNWWITEWEQLHQVHWGDLAQIQKVVYSGLYLEQAGHVPSALEWVEWQLTVWRFFLLGQGDLGAQGLPMFKDKSSAEIIKLAQASILESPNDLLVNQILAFWLKAQAAGLIKTEERYKITALYLTYFGQALLGKRRSQAWQGLGRALRYSWHPQGMQAWRQFVTQGIRYFRNNGRNRQAAPNIR